VAKDKEYNETAVLVVGAGPAGLSCAIKLKTLRPDIDICVIDKAAELGNHNLSGAVLEAEALHELLDSAAEDWRQSEAAKEVLAKKVDKDDVMFMLGRYLSFNIFSVIKMAKSFGLGFGKMIHMGDYIVSISKLTKWLGQIAKDLGVEVLTGFGAEDIVYDQFAMKAEGVKLVDQGLDKEGNKQPNYVTGETIAADFVVLAEGCDGLVTERFVKKAELERKSPQLYSVGVKELIKVSSEQYQKFTAGRVVHAMGYPIWMPVFGPTMFGGGIIYPGDDDHISVGMIVGADWKYYNLNPQDALTNFKNHRFVKQFIEGGTVVEAGAKMIPEGGYYAVPRDHVTGAIGKGNVMILGDSAGFVNMLKIKGLHNAIDSGIRAAEAIDKSFDAPLSAAVNYTKLVDGSNITREMKSAANYRQTIAKFGNTLGFPLSVLANMMPRFKVEKDFESMRTDSYRLKGEVNFDKDTFTAVAATEHREEQPCHLHIIDPELCEKECNPRFGMACIAFCPAGVYETIGGVLKAANPSNCLHCKTCQRKCPFDNIRWVVPEGAGGPRYKRM